MDSERFSAIDLLKDCVKLKDIQIGLNIHDKVIAQGLDKNFLVGNALVHMYARCGALSRAKALVLRLLPFTCVFAWSALMAGYVAYGYHKEALICFQHMKIEGNLCLHSGALSRSLKACAKTGDFEKGQEIHMETVKREILEGDQILCNSLIHMYAQSGWLHEAIHVFEDVRDKDVVSWAALMAGYMKHGFVEETLKCLVRMRIMGISPDSVALICCLKSCSNIGDVESGKEIHLQVTKMGLLFQKDASLGNALLDLYVNCGMLLEARDVLDKLQCKDVVSWTALIAGYAKYGHGKVALEFFEKMQGEGISANEVSFLCILQACASENATKEGREIHAEIYKRGLLEMSSSLGNTLVLMYADCGLLKEAQEVFNHLIPDAVSWTALMGGYINYGYGEKALNCFNQMQNERVALDDIAYVCCLNACASLGALDQGQEIHAEISCKGLVITHIEVGNALVDMYAKCGMFIEAKKVINDLPMHDTVSWNAIITGYVKHNQGEAALCLFEKMQEEDVPVDVVTLICGVKACGMLAAFEKGRTLHDAISKRGFLEKDLIGNSLIAMYAMCGVLPNAIEVFEKIPVRDVVSWTLLIIGYAQLGETDQVFHLFDRMREDVQDPNLITFIGVLNACSHGGLVDTGYMCFEHMILDIGITPTLEHYSCMVDMLGRAGQLDKVVAIVEHMPLLPNRVIWSTILGACRNRGNMMVGGRAFVYVLGLDDEDVASYISMSNIYAYSDIVNQCILH